MSAINLLTLQGYYYLYALFFDYPLNNEFHLEREERERIRDLLRRVQPFVQRQQPDRVDWAVRLFTQRQLLERYSPERVHELLRQLRQTVDLYAPAPHPLRRASDPGVARRRNQETRRRRALPAPPPPAVPVVPHSPVDYRLTA